MTFPMTFYEFMGNSLPCSRCQHRKQKCREFVYDCGPLSGACRSCLELGEYCSNQAEDQRKKIRMHMLSQDATKFEPTGFSQGHKPCGSCKKLKKRCEQTCVDPEFRGSCFWCMHRMQVCSNCVEYSNSDNTQPHLLTQQNVHPHMARQLVQVDGEHMQSMHPSMQNMHSMQNMQNMQNMQAMQSMHYIDAGSLDLAAMHAGMVDDERLMQMQMSMQQMNRGLVPQIVSQTQLQLLQGQGGGGGGGGGQNQSAFSKVPDPQQQQSAFSKVDQMRRQGGPTFQALCVPPGHTVPAVHAVPGWEQLQSMQADLRMMEQDNAQQQQQQQQQHQQQHQQQGAMQQQQQQGAMQLPRLPDVRAVVISSAMQ